MAEKFKLKNGLSKLGIALIEYMLANPNTTVRDAAIALGKDPMTGYRYYQNEDWQEEYARRLRMEWAGSVRKAKKKIESLVDSERDDIALSASKYILDSNGFNAVQKVDVNANAEAKLEIKVDYGEES